MTTELAKVPKSVAEKAKRIAEFVGRVEAMGKVALADDAHYQSAGEMLKLIKTEYADLEGDRVSLKAPLLEATRGLDAYFAPRLAALNGARDVLGGLMKRYRDRVEKKRLEAQAAVEEVARKEQERLEKEAARLEAKGKTEQAEMKREIAAAVVAPVVHAAPPKIEGLNKPAKRWRCNREVDKMTLIKAVAEGKVPALALDENFAFLDNQARQLKAEFNYPGCKAEETESRM